jgi:hypothetical protein
MQAIAPGEKCDYSSPLSFVQKLPPRIAVTASSYYQYCGPEDLDDGTV